MLTAVWPAPSAQRTQPAQLQLLTPGSASSVSSLASRCSPPFGQLRQLKELSLLITLFQPALSAQNLTPPDGNFRRTQHKKKSHTGLPYHNNQTQPARIVHQQQLLRLVT
ncbi:hypothetical protein PtA15_3A417 [Puccinia triticina]|uniref:Uncharacterized protein n=1 Tax=Puccinia triticina TaxID=208348 RepID=A0ABY7CFY0_9BASI|nr:uncharacterized protein PtA15_3A417 [Puccinia triticina]WAQ83051.1 hypothetical protein PtA15_3A417 [Puccinia triticina]